MKQLLYFIITVNLIATVSCQPKTDYYVRDVDCPIISLNGTWKVSNSSFRQIKKADQSEIQWVEIQVPGECMMQGFPIKHDQPFIYSTEFDIPSDYKAKLIKIRFEGVYSYAKVWLNGNYIRDHSGGFTAWECDITSAVQAGQKAVMMVEVTDRADEISYASGYAKHMIGGILRNVSLMALPENYPVRLSVTTDLDKVYKDAKLIVEGEIRNKEEGCSIELELYDNENNRIGLDSSKLLLAGTHFRLQTHVADPLKWDAEHPNLYNLKVAFIEQGRATWHRIYPIGFREIEVAGNKFLVNGKEVKLRGACRHDIHPMLGRLTTADYDLQDVLLAKEANMNFIRTSHYPPSEKFLELCDKHGLYVEDETAVCFVGSHRTSEYLPGSSENSAAFTERYLLQLEEMITIHRNHPSVIMWSIGNENEFGYNFKKSYDWVKKNDPSRPVIFSYPGKVPDSIKSYDIISMHYPGTDGNMNQYSITTTAFGHEKMPVLFDEWAHVACYNSATVKEDPNIRDFWGISLDSMWQKVFKSDGGLGGAIWCMVDETFMLPEDLPGYNEWWGKLDKNIIPGEFTGQTIGYGEWGIIDAWRRKKPDFWSVKKAYSPVRVTKTGDYEIIPGKPVEIPVLNRFDFTNLNEIKITISVNDQNISVEAPDVAPHNEGIIRAEVDSWASGEKLMLWFHDRNGNLLDSYELSLRLESLVSLAPPAKGPAELSDDSMEYKIICDNGIILTIDKSTGLLKGFENQSGQKKISGPHANIRVLGKEVIYSSFLIEELCNEWKMKSLSAKKSGDDVIVEISGSYASSINAQFALLISPSGTIQTVYKFDGIPDGRVREAGIEFIFDNDFDSISWKRKPYWSSYPAGHLSEPSGSVPLYTSVNKIYREVPGKEWQFDKKSFFYNGTSDETDDQLINAARATKENIFEYSLMLKGDGRVVVKAKGDKSCRIEKMENGIRLNISDFIDYPDISWGNYSRNIKLNGSLSGKTELVFYAGISNIYYPCRSY